MTQETFRLDGAVAVITGGARGIGRATAEAFIQAGAIVHLLDRDGDAVKACSDEVAGVAGAHPLDVTDEAAVDGVFSAIRRDEGRIDILVNNAGIAIRRPTTELSLADWQRVVDVNMTGAFLCAQAAGRAMTVQGKGAIVNVASIMGLSGGGLYPNISYQTTKGAVVNMTRALAVEWASAGVRVNAVAPTWVETDLIASLQSNPEFTAAVERLTPMRRLAKPGEVANAILFLASAAASMITGHVLPVDGGFLAQ
ncbi:SDR family NAD(P)-dependent oxidoreductase [Pandoraea anhela]|uniref:3-oxoacyl-(Acyl-carrier-protein) reductase n=1 Tax=Pandoraea anhela TaxID=2508295 RepID=A0A5E4W0K9_9BURK|nr:SDR family oxidoreductase [Pandoraea anhela]VVE16810.1 3-oxoacyl-(acyl-carrier-protein) reductase [Pandoraea anhela]